MLLPRIVRWFRRCLGRPSPSVVKPEPARKSLTFTVESLESRVVPVVGAFQKAVAVTAGKGGYDGVVLLQVHLPGEKPKFGSGSLLRSGRHILTAAHNVQARVEKGENILVRFDLPGRSVTLEVSPGDVLIHEDWWALNRGKDPDEYIFNQGNDIAILTLPQLAPTGPTGVGADRYEIQRVVGPEIGQQFEVVGYGEGGEGKSGRDLTPGTKRKGSNTWDMEAATMRNEVQVVTPLRASPFRLRYGSGPATRPIPASAKAAVVRRALEGLEDLEPGDVRVNGGPALDAPWFVEFRGRLAGLDVKPIRTSPAKGSSVKVHTLYDGGTVVPPSGTLVADFDNGMARHDAFGLFHGVKGLGVRDFQGIFLEAFAAPGDSGGPAFLTGNVIAGVVSYRNENRHVNAPPDIDGHIRPTNTRGNLSFGEFQVMTRVATHAAWIQAAADARHHLVVDMANQPAGGNGGPDTITVKRVGDDLVLQLPGEHKVALAQVESLTIRASDDAESFLVHPDVGIPVFLEGTDAADTLSVMATAAADTITLEPGKVTGRPTAGGTPTTIHYGVVKEIMARAAGGSDLIRVEGTAPDTPVTVQLDGWGFNHGLHTVSVTPEGKNLNLLQGVLTIRRGNLGFADLIVDDSGGPAETVALGAWHNARTNLIGRPGGGMPILYEAVRSIHFWAGTGQTVDVGSGSTVTVIAGSGIVNVGGLDRRLDNFAGLVTVVGRDGSSGPVVNLDNRLGTGMLYTVGPEGVQFRGLGTSADGRVMFNGVAKVVLQGGASADLFKMEGTPAAAVRVEAGGGADRLDYTAYPTGVVVNLGAGVATGLDAGVGGVEHVTGSAGDDHLVGDDAANSLHGGEGDDRLEGLGGDDVLSGGLGDDWLSGGDGRDSLYATAALVSGAGSDTLIGGPGADRLFAADGIGDDHLDVAEDALWDLEFDPDDTLTGGP